MKAERNLLENPNICFTQTHFDSSERSSTFRHSSLRRTQSAKVLGRCTHTFAFSFFSSIFFKFSRKREVLGLNPDSALPCSCLTVLLVTVIKVRQLVACRFNMLVRIPNFSLGSWSACHCRCVCVGTERINVVDGLKPRCSSCY